MVSRDELYRLVWSQPMTKVAAEFGISGSYLARVCIALRVPRPERGYWAKLQVGKAPPAPPLPAPRIGDLQGWIKDVALPPVAAPETRPVGPPDTRPRRRLMRKTHELIGGAREHFEAGRKIEAGEYLRPFKKLLVDITVSETQLIRALDFANTLFNALETQGHRVGLAHRGLSLWRINIDENEVPKKRVGERYPKLWSPDEPTVVYFGEVPVGLALVELSEAVLMRNVNGAYVRESEYVPPKTSRYKQDYTWTSMQDLRSGRLRLIAYAPRYGVDLSMQWQEAKGQSLRDQISAIVAAMPAFAIDVAAKVQVAELASKRRLQEHAEAMERLRREDDRKKMLASHDESRKQLEEIIEDWASALSFERFFRGIEEGAALLPEDKAVPILDRLVLARELIGTLDPMQYFLDWRAPLELYQPTYDHIESPSPTDDE